MCVWQMWRIFKERAVCFAFFFFNTRQRVGILQSRERTVASSEAQTGMKRATERMWGCILNNSYAWYHVWFTRQAGKKLITPTDGCPIQRKCQKDSHDSQSTCEKEHSTGNTMDLQMVICAGRWWKVHHKCLYHLISRDKTICVC